MSSNDSTNNYSTDTQSTNKRVKNSEQSQIHPLWGFARARSHGACDEGYASPK